MEAAKITPCLEFEKYVTILIDEMYVKEDLVYNKSIGSYISVWLLFHAHLNTFS